MNKLFTRIAISLSLFLGAGLAFGQTALTQTTLSAAVTSNVRTIQVASATGITAPGATTGAGSLLFVDAEAMSVLSVNSTYVTVQRGAAGTKATGHISGAAVLLGPPQAFIAFDPSGSCTNGQGLFLYSPVVNINTGNEWLCSTVTGKIVPGFGNVGGVPQVTTAVASAAGLVTPSGPLFHITGTAAITGFNIPVGFDPKEGGTICAIPDGAFTTTNANNIAIASTGVVSKILCWTYDANTAKFYPAY
jgi:hypothetical protein